MDIIDEAQSLIELTITQQITQIRKQHALPSSLICLECGDVISEDRRRLVLGVRLCVECQSALEFRVRVGNKGVKDE